MKGIDDEIGPWSEVKLEIIRSYAVEYSKIISSSFRNYPRFKHIYIDAFAGSGTHISREKGKEVPGSPTIALETSPPFKEYHFIDINELKIGSLEKLRGTREDVFIYHGDCNEILTSKVLPRVKYQDYRRALCILDPYGLHLQWSVIHQIGQMESIDIFLNFPSADINRNIRVKHPSLIKDEHKQRMNSFWGDESWMDVTYSDEKDLFGEKPVREPAIALSRAFQERLINVAGFKKVPNPLPMKNSKNAIVYYLFFASHKPVAERIVQHIFKKYSS